MKKVYIGVGHGGADVGSTGYLIEKNVNLNMALACRDFLMANGVDVKISRVVDEDSGLNDKINECNRYNPDLALDIHNNAGGGDGFEVYYTINGGTGKILAENIEKEVKAIGQNSRGIKTRKNDSGTDYFGFIRLVKCPSVITETVFVDNKQDSEQADTLNEQKNFGIAIAKGILDTLNIKISNDKTEEKTENTTEKVENDKSEGKDRKIANIQSELNKRYGLNIKVDNIYGSETKQALVKGLQTELNKQFSSKLQIDGIFGNETKKACVIVGKGAEGNITWILQAILVCKGYNIVVDGDFGNATKSAVEDYQEKNKLKIDGIAGPETFYSLLS